MASSCSLKYHTHIICACGASPLSMEGSYRTMHKHDFVNALKHAWKMDNMQLNEEDAKINGLSARMSM